MRITLSLFCCLFLFQFSSFSQEQLGLRTEKYSGVNSLSLNPANGSHFALGWDFNIVGAGLFMENNFLYAAPTNIPHLISNSKNIKFVPDLESPPGNGLTDDVFVDFQKDNKTKFFNLYTEIMGPALLININNSNAIGFQTKLRAAFGGSNIDNDLGYYQYQDIALGKPLELEPFSITGMVWQEYALSYSHSIDTYFGKASFGGSLKLMKAYESFYFDLAQPLISNKVQDDSLYISEFDASFGFTTASLEAESFGNQITGQGFAVDLGASFLIDSDGEGDYFAKLGVAILDLGKVNFDKHTERYLLKNSTPTELSADDFSGVNTQAEAFEALSTAILGDSLAARQAAGYSLWAPTALSLQGDIQVKRNLFLGASLIQSIPLSSLSVRRNNSLALLPRFENRWFSLGLPMVLYNWQDFRLGTSMRIGFITIGSDNLGSFVGRSNLSGSDIYLAIKANPFTFGLFGGGKGRKKAKSVKCYNF